MIIGKIILCFIVLLVVPELLGLLITKIMKEDQNLFSSMVIGYLAEFTSFEIIYLILFFGNFSFRVVQYTWTSIIFIISTISLFLNIKNFKTIIHNTIQDLKKMSKLIIIFIIMVVLQIYVPVRYMQHVDPDDSFYLGISTTAIQTNTMFKFDPYNGKALTKSPLRYALSGLTIYFAVIAKDLNIHTAILEHTIWPAIIISLEYIVYAYIGKKLFKNDKSKLTYFLIFLAMINIFGFISVYTNFSFMAYRSWQGKAMIANFIIPLTWLIFLECIEKNKKIGWWLLLTSVVISSTFMTELGVIVLPMIIGVLCILNFIREKKISNVLKSIICCLPQVILGYIYLIFK